MLSLYDVADSLLFSSVSVILSVKCNADKTNLERLADDVLYEVFEYLGGISTLRPFSLLNSRFDVLLIIHFRNHPLDFYGSSKYDFDLVCREKLPSMVEHITALRLSDGDGTTHQIDPFLSRGWNLSRFVHLRSMSIANVVGLLFSLVSN